MRLALIKILGKQTIFEQSSLYPFPGVGIGLVMPHAIEAKHLEKRIAIYRHDKIIQPSFQSIASDDAVRDVPFNLLPEKGVGGIQLFAQIYLLFIGAVDVHEYFFE